MRVPVLTYHSINISGDDAARNDHVALAADLALLRREGWRVVPLHDVVAALLGERDSDAFERCVALTFDDGSWFDWFDLEHPTWGMQRSFANILRDAGPGLHATSFVIVSPDARAVLDRTCMIGRGWWTDGWWPDAAREGLIAIESHSWDHNHDTLPETAQRNGRTGTFRSIDSCDVADAEIRQAANWLDARLPGQRTSLLAYPYGETNAYLVEDYLPRHAHEHRVRAAFTTEATPITSSSKRWMLPRYVCGRDWRSTEELQRVLVS